MGVNYYHTTMFSLIYARMHEIVLCAPPRARYVFLMSPFPEGTSASFNASHFEEIQRVIDVAAPGGMRVLLDVHQDLYSSAVCGEGASDAINATRVLPFPQPINAAIGPGDYVWALRLLTNLSQPYSFRGGQSQFGAIL